MLTDTLTIVSAAPVSASHVRNEKADVTISGSFEALPQFWGNSVVVSFNGTRRVSYGGGGGGPAEEYTMNQPCLVFRGIFGLGRQFAEWTGEVVIRCPAAGTIGRIRFLPRGFLGMSGEVSSLRVHFGRCER